MAHRILRPLNNRDLIDEMFDLYKKNFKLFVGISLVICLPLGLLNALAADAAGQNGRGSDMAAVMVGLIALITIPVYMVAQGAATWAVSRCYLDNPPTIIESYKSIVSRLWPYLLTLLLSYVVTFLGFVVLIVPGVLLAFRLVFLTQVFVLEKLSYTAAIKRSYKLVSSDAGRVIGMLFLAAIIHSVVSAIVEVPFSYLQVLAVSKPSLWYTFGVVQGVADGVIDAFLMPMLIITYVLLYYDVRVKKEGFDLTMLAESMGETVEPIAVKAEAELS